MQDQTIPISLKCQRSWISEHATTRLHEINTRLLKLEKSCLRIEIGYRNLSADRQDWMLEIRVLTNRNLVRICEISWLGGTNARLVL